MTIRSDYRIETNKVLAYLSKVIVATQDMIIEEAEVKPHNIRRMIHDKILTTSLNYNHNWLIPTKAIKKRKDHWGFYRHRIGRYNRTVPIFHIKRTAKATLSFLASKRPWGITVKEAEKLLGRKCDYVLKQLVDAVAIQERLCNGEKVYLHRIHKRANIQINCRRTNPRFRKEETDEDNEDKAGVITYEEFCESFREVINEMDNKIDISYDRMCALLLMYKTNNTLRTMETWIAYNERIQNAIRMPSPVDHTTLNRAFSDIDEDFLKQLFHSLVMKLHDKNVITGRFLVVDATHIHAYCNTRLDTSNNPVEGAAWGEHQGSFYGYKVHIIIDADSEMPIGMILSSGEDHDSAHFIPLIRGFRKNYDFDEIIAVLADGAYDVEYFRKYTRKKTCGIFLPACNPRRNKNLQMLKKKVKKLFDRYGDRIGSVQDALGFLSQKFLTDYRIEIGSKQQSKLVELISERLHRPYRAAVERVFSRLKAMTAFERPKSRRIKSVIKTIWWCLIGYLVQALTASNKGLNGSMRKRTMLV